MDDRTPWRCPDCNAWIRPDVEAHWCDPDGGVNAGRPNGPKRRPPAEIAVPGEYGPEFAVVPAGGGGGGATSVTWMFPPGTSVTTSAGRQYELHPPGTSTVTATLDGRAIFEAVQRETFKYNIRQGRPRGTGAA